MNDDIYRLIFEKTVEGILVLDSKGIIRFTNPRLCEMFGYSDENLVGQEMKILLPNHVKEGHHKHEHSFHEKEERRLMGLVVEGQMKNGQLIPLEIGLNLINYKEQKYTIALISDISERRMMEAELEKSYEYLESEVEKRTVALQEALNKIKDVNENLISEVDKRKKAELNAKKLLKNEKELGELKSRFLTMASHEFRTPLSGILTSSALVGKYLELGDHEKIERHLGKITTSVHNLTGILLDFLSIEKLQSKNIEVRVESIIFGEFLNQIVENFEPVLKSGQEIEINSACDDLTINTDTQLLSTVVNNLLSNAIKYSLTDQLIEIRVKKIDKVLQMEIRDHGIGIPEADQKYLFNQFFRAGNVENIAGTGLGLNIVKKQIELLNGKVNYRNNDDVCGSIFTVEIPINYKL